MKTTQLILNLTDSAGSVKNELQGNGCSVSSAKVRSARDEVLQYAQKFYSERNKFDVFTVYWQINDNCGPKLHSWYKQETLAARLHMSVRRLQRILNILYADGFLRKRQYAGDRTINDYCLAMVEAKLGIAAPARSVVQDTTPVVVFTAPPPIYEPLKEPVARERPSDTVSFIEPEPKTAEALPGQRQFPEIPQIPEIPPSSQKSHDGNRESQGVGKGRKGVGGVGKLSPAPCQDPEVVRVLIPLLAMYAQSFAMRDWHGREWQPEEPTVVASILASGGGRSNLYRIGAYLKERYGDAVRHRRKIEGPGWLVMVVRNHFSQGDNPRPACQPTKPLVRAAVAAPARALVPAAVPVADMAFVHDAMARLAGVGRRMA